MLFRELFEDKKWGKKQNRYLPHNNDDGGLWHEVILMWGAQTGTYESRTKKKQKKTVSALTRWIGIPGFCAFLEAFFSGSVQRQKHGWSWKNSYYTLIPALWISDERRDTVIPDLKFRYLRKYYSWLTLKRKPADTRLLHVYHESCIAMLKSGLSASASLAIATCRPLRCSYAVFGLSSPVCYSSMTQSIRSNDKIDHEERTTLTVYY